MAPANSSEKPPPEFKPSDGPGNHCAKYSYYDGVLYCNKYKRESAGEIRDRLRNYNDPAKPVTRTYMIAQYGLWGCSTHLQSDINKDDMRKLLIEALNNGWCDLVSPIAREFEEIVRRIYYDLEPLLKPGELPLYRSASSGNNYGNWYIFPEARDRYLAWMTPEWKARFHPDPAKKRRMPDSRLGPEAQAPVKRIRKDADSLNRSHQSHDWIDPTDTVFEKILYTHPALLKQKFAALDAGFTSTKPRVFAAEGPGAAQATYSYFDGQLYFDLYTREPRDLIEYEVRGKDTAPTRNWMIAQLHLWGCSVSSKGELDRREVLQELCHSLASGWCDHVAPHMVDFEENLRREYEGLPLAFPASQPLYKQLPSWWYPGYSGPLDDYEKLSPHFKERWNTAMYEQWGSSFDHMGECTVRNPLSEGIIMYVAVREWRLQSDGRGFIDGHCILPFDDEDDLAEYECKVLNSKNSSLGADCC